ncbi:divalent cation tolerance protein, CutA1 family protein [Toxoplasma gondii VEG]|uniref:CutA1 divalent ion tolerance domain-containing protein n=1 Tax=Toxoplasma gondii (strain ATCC 50861 / VEG) TaxID=432359 RepID=V4ZAX0_TOXGV|nr:divalent cation tolerance protein, CutA1 family protein [Toxoplasma gondii VEG]CEL76624.1 TPA: CutA1 divalent ion tolerance domain-containing protein [Toxoplasma gondii VEG]
MVPRMWRVGGLRRPFGVRPDVLVSCSLLLSPILYRLASSHSTSSVPLLSAASLFSSASLLSSASLFSPSSASCPLSSPSLPGFLFASTLASPARAEAPRLLAEASENQVAAVPPSSKSHSTRFSVSRVCEEKDRNMEGAAAASKQAIENAVQVAYVTCKDKTQAEEVASKLVENRLAACVNIVPGITSIYEWEGKMEKDEEVLLIVKTRKELAAEVVAAVRKWHSYDVPEVIFLDVAGGNEPYLDWVKRNTQRTR